MAPTSKAAIERLVNVISNLEMKINDFYTKLEHCHDTIKSQNLYISKQDEKITQLLTKIDELKNMTVTNKNIKKRRNTKTNKNQIFHSLDNSIGQHQNTINYMMSNPVSSIPPRLSVPLTLDDSGPHGITMIQQPVHSIHTHPTNDNETPLTSTHTLTPDTNESTKTANPLITRERKLKSGVGGLRAAPPRVGCLHLFNFDVDTTPEDIQLHLQSQLRVKSISCERLPTRGEYASFKLEVPASNVPSIRNSKLWPAGVSIRKFNIITDSKNLIRNTVRHNRS